MIGKILGVFAVLVGVFVILFLGGLFSAWWEIREERKAGQEPTRPGWEANDKRRALGGFLPAAAVWFVSLRSPVPLCWCGMGPVVDFLEPTGQQVAGRGCAAWEAGNTTAILRHEEAGGYARVPFVSDADAA